MTGRSVPEWVGRTLDSKIPPRVKLRVLETHNHICHISGLTIRPGDKWDCDHVIALANEGENRESNLKPALRAKHREKTKADVAEKALFARKKKSAFGIKKASGRSLTHPTLKRRFDGTVVAR